MTTANVQLLLTGNELMIGDIVDSNSAMIAKSLKALGIKIYKKVTVADDLNLLVTEIENISHNADLLIINGGLGPTSDDLTAQALALAANLPIEQHPEALTHLQKWCERRAITLSQSNLKQALLPKGCDIVDNSTGSAVGFSLILNGCLIICTPGVPHELKLMIDQEILPLLQDTMKLSGEMDNTRFQVFGFGESTLQTLIEKEIPDWPAEVELGFRAAMPTLELKLTIENKQHLFLKTKVIDKLKNLLGAHLIEEITEQEKTLAEHVVQLCREQNLKITLAESCTGGLLASEITRIGGASSVFEAGFVTYSNVMKQKMLDVDPTILERFGAVSAETVLAMARGALNKADADIVIAVSGIAGPDGGSRDKPVGSVWIAWGTKEQMFSQYFCLKGNRHYFQQMVTARALDLVRRMLINNSDTPNYFL
ncbi:CinA family nicotinamide mononucleotide deamidase-related protein [Psychromonas sp.]|uniref:CinA family nicotinamide mononucleotide deamidase-related protein n=1 Tax=Psychromonas sp. TaxID=1884585 RepID=UPI00356A5028